MEGLNHSKDMKILLIDADSTIPNLALMKLSAWYKAKGGSVDLLRLNIPYYPNRKKKHMRVDTQGYDLSYCSCIFEGTKEYVVGDNIMFGGTGVSLERRLDPEVESMLPDYSIYPDNDTSYGFISRGCIRNCYFCKVPKKEGAIKQVSTVDDIVRHKKVKFLDNNILALPEHKRILQELVDKKIRCTFNQGLDIRLLDEENSFLLSKMNYLGEYTFAFDDWATKNAIEEKLPLLSWAKPWQLRFFVYANPKMYPPNYCRRISFLRDRQILPYFMRDIECWDSPLSNFFVDLASWCNQPNILKKIGLEEFLGRRHKNKSRIEKSAHEWRLANNSIDI